MKYLNLDKSYDIYITMTWNLPDVSGRRSNHGISGHIYEMVEYYLILNENNIKAGLLICEDLDWSILHKAITTKYNLPESTINQILKDTIFSDRPTIVRGKNILFTDGNFWDNIIPSGIKLIFDNIFSFKCLNTQIHSNLPYKNIILLQDQRVYNQDTDIAIDYKKKIKFENYKQIKKTVTNTALLYITSNCRKVCDDYLLDVVVDCNFSNYIILTDKPEEYRLKFKHLPHLQFPDMPIKDIFEKFDTFIYTPTYMWREKNDFFDCSPRFIAECKFYDKNVIYYDINDDYLDIDTGLKFRKYDIENNFNSIFLNNTDNIIDIINEKNTSKN
jgi:hypothetical protein|tara:strand:- start:13269 stop:14261 length:993 start_codon:yes stop_codon:yes gene_type:complete